MKRRKGWFKKAKEKFVSKRVFSWEISLHSFSRGAKLSFVEGEMSIRYINRDRDYQVVKTISYFGYARGFWKARKYAKKHPDKWDFYFDKNIEI